MNLTAYAGIHDQVGELASALRASREEVAAQVAAATAKDRENSQLWEQVHTPVQITARVFLSVVITAGCANHLFPADNDVCVVAGAECC